jgi:D-alanyl-lipoteichoic acid acyltransferase DltB (MBOAT superfamily)
MAFNSSIFIASFLTFLLLYGALAHKQGWRKWLILIFSLAFYWLLSTWGIAILLINGISDFFIAKGIAKSKSPLRKRLLLYSSVLLNVGLILCFRHFTQWFALNQYFFWPAVAGISFFVFRSLGYVLDVYHENMEEPVDSAVDYLAYLSFFPLILQGPISPARDFLPELKSPFSWEKVNTGRAFFYLSSGIIKKFCLAAYLGANFTDRVFESPHLFTGMEVTLASVAQALLVFLDFSGYTDLMMGIAMLMGFQIAENFNFPYIAGNITEYWRRWHMSLSKWLNEYLFFPLSFSLRSLSKWGTVLAVMITFIISGFWHGTSLNYTFWGMLHGLALSWDVISNNLRHRIKSVLPGFMYSGISVFLTFAFLSLSGIYFRQENMETANAMLLQVFTQPDWHLFPQWLKDFGGVFGVICVTLILHWVLPKYYEKTMQFFEKLPWPFHSLLLLLVIFTAYQISGLEPVPFIYQKF